MGARSAGRRGGLVVPTPASEGGASVGRMTSLATDLERLGAEFWEWRDATSFRTSDDIPRVERPAGWLPRFDRSAVDEFALALAGFAERWRAIEPRASARCPSRRRSTTGCSAPRWPACTGSSSCCATGSATRCSSPRRCSARGSTCCSRRRRSTRARQSDLVRGARGDPGGRRAGRREPRARRRRDARTGRRGRARDIGARLERSVSAVAPLTDAATAAALRAAQPGASAALERYRAWLAASADGLGPDVIVGREAFTWYLRHVALVTHDPEELVRAAMQDYRRSVVAEAATRTRYREVPEAPLAASAAARVGRRGRGRGRGAGVLRGIGPAEPARLAAALPVRAARPPTSSPSRSSA